MTLGEVLAGALPERELAPDLARVEVAGLEYDSRRVGPGFVFFAFPGARADGRTFAKQALERGAVAVVSESEAPAELAPGASPKALAGRGLLIEQWDADRIGIDGSLCGLSGSPTRVGKIDPVALAGSAFKKIEPNDQGIRELFEELIADHTFD